MKNIFFLILASVLVVLISHFSMSHSNGLFLNEHKADNRVFLGILLAGAMLLGIVAGRVHKLIEQDEDFHVKLLWEYLLSDNELWKSLVSSPIIFGVVYSALSESNDIVVSLIFSFQNGFFCNVIFSRKRKELEGEG